MTKNFLNLFLLFLMTTLFSSCTAIAGIFKAGVWTGIFFVVAIIVLIVVAISRFRK